MDEWMGIRRAGFQQTYLDVRVLAQAGRKYATGGTCTHDNVVEHACLLVEQCVLQCGLWAALLRFRSFQTIDSAFSYRFNRAAALSFSCAAELYVTGDARSFYARVADRRHQKR
jgi:hypothetical protein